MHSILLNSSKLKWFQLSENKKKKNSEHRTVKYVKIRCCYFDSNNNCLPNNFNVFKTTFLLETVINSIVVVNIFAQNSVKQQYCNEIMFSQILHFIRQMFAVDYMLLIEFPDGILIYIICIYALAFWV